LRIDVRQSGEFAAAVRRAKSSGKLTALPSIQLKTDLGIKEASCAESMTESALSASLMTR